MNLANVFRQALELWQNPPDTELSEETFVNCANRCVTQRGVDLDLTPDACFATVKSNEFQFDGPDSREVSLEGVGITDISRKIRVESRDLTSTNEDDWEEETIASFDNWNDTMERQGNFVAFYGTTPSILMVVNRDVSDHSFRLVYRQLQPKLASISSVVELPDIYEPVLVYDIALEMGELIDNQSPEFLKKKSDKMPYLIGRLKEAVDRADKWRRSQRGTSVTRRRRFDDRMPTFGTNGTRRFTVNW
jgi:hypothetical protein